MDDLARLGIAFETQGDQRAISALDQVAAKSGSAEKAVGDLASANRRADASARGFADAAMQEASASDLLAASMHDAARAAGVVEAAMDSAATAQTRMALASMAVNDNTRLAGWEIANFGRQLGDVATMASMGASPMMILSTQGFQIAEAFGLAAQRGVTFGGAMSQLGGAAAGAATKFWPVAAAVGAGALAFAAFEKQVDDSTEGATSWGDAWTATVTVVGRHLMDGPLGTAIDWVGNRWNDLLDFVANAAFEGMARVNGAFVGTLRTVQAHWGDWPTLFEGLIVAGVNLGIMALERFVNANTDALNAVIKAWNGLPMFDLPSLPRIEFDALLLEPMGRARAFNEDLQESIRAETERTRDALRGMFGEIVTEAERLRDARDENAKSAKSHAAATKQEVEALDDLHDRLRAVLEALETPQERALREMHAQMRTLREAFDENKLSVDDYREAIDRAWYKTKELAEVTGVELVQAAGAVNDIALDTYRKELEAILELTNGIGWAFDDFVYAIENQDWPAAFAGLIDTLKYVKELWNSGQDGARSSAVGSLLSSAGGAIGGTAGSVLGSVGSGFSAAGAISSMGGAIAGLAGPIGFAVAGFSLLNSVLSSQEAKKRAKREAEARDIANAAAIAQQQLETQRELELELLRLSGDEVAYVTRQREMEIEGLDRTSAALQRQIWALEDWADEVAKAEQALSAAEAALTTAYNADMGALQEIIDAVAGKQDQLNAAYERQRDAITDLRDQFDEFAESLRAFRRDLYVGPSAMLSPEAQYQASRSEFQSVSAAAMGGDQDALGRLQSVSQAYLDASRAYYASSAGYFEDLEAVRDAVAASEAYAEGQVELADQQLMALEKQVDGLVAVNDNLVSVEQAISELLNAQQAAAIAVEQQTLMTAQYEALLGINTSVMSLAEAMAGYAAATQALADAQAAKPANDIGPTYEVVGPERYVDMNPDLAALYASGSGMASGRSKAEFGLYHWQRYGQGEDRFYRPFANGGMFGPGGVVMGPTAFPMGMAGEAGPEAIMPLVNNGGQMGVRAVTDPRVVEALNEVRDELRRANVQRGAAAEETIKRLENVVEGLERVERKTGDLAA